MSAFKVQTWQQKKQNFEKEVRFKSNTAVLTLINPSLYLLLSSFAFLAPFFSFAGHLLFFIWVGKVFIKGFRIVG